MFFLNGKNSTFSAHRRRSTGQQMVRSRSRSAQRLMAARAGGAYSTKRTKAQRKLRWPEPLSRGVSINWDPSVNFCSAVFAHLTTGVEGESGAEEIETGARKNRVIAISSAAGLFAVAICFRLYALQGSQHDSWLQLAAKQHSTQIEIQGARGSILDRHGRTLSTSVENLSVALHPQLVRNKERTAEVLAKTVGVEPAQVLSLLNQKKTFVWLARGLPAAKRAEFEKLRMNGITLIPEFDRYYPQGALAGPLLGTVGRNGDGLSGIELGFNEPLRASTLELAVRRDARGHQLTTTGWSDPAAAFQTAALHSSSRNEGDEIVLTIDAVLQAILEEELAKGVADSRAKRAFGIVMDADSGEILALGQVPGFNPNQRTGLSGELLRNYFAQDSFEPGSTLKPLIAAVALDRGVVGSEEVMNCEKSGRYRVGRHTIRDVHPVGIAPLRDVLVRSSNICMAKIGQRLGGQQVRAALQLLGFGAPTGVELPGEAKGILRDLKNWKEIDTVTNSFGQGVAVTGLQLVRAYAALANGGVLPVPTLIRGDGRPTGARIFKQTTADRIALFLRGVTEDKAGTAQRAKINGVSVSGKTGTAQKPVLGGRGYRQDAVLSSFIGFINGRELGVDQKLVTFIVVDEPGGFPRWGGTVAAPIYKRAMERILSHLITLQDVQSADARPGMRQKSPA